MKMQTMILMTIGLLTVIYGLTGLTLDILAFDQTKGGYEYPYESWSGNPVDWDSMDTTPIGLVKRGYVLDVFVNGTTGMISFGLLGMKMDWQTFSDRALKVHQPREALRRRGFNPQF